MAERSGGFRRLSQHKHSGERGGRDAIDVPVWSARFLSSVFASDAVWGGAVWSGAHGRERVQYDEQPECVCDDRGWRAGLPGELALFDSGGEGRLFADAV